MHCRAECPVCFYYALPFIVLAHVLYHMIESVGFRPLVSLKA